MPLQFTVHPAGSMTPSPPSAEGGGDPYAAYDDAPPAPPQQAADPYAAYSDEPPPKKVSREIGAPESFGIGAREGVTFGAFPAIHGLISAGQSKEEREAAEKGYASGETPSAASELAALFKGLFRVGHEHLIEPALGEASKTYREERERALKEQESAEAQNPKSYIGGQLASALATPIGGSAKAATALGRMGKGAVAGGLGGAAYGLGGGISAGDDAGQLAADTGLGTITGLGLGGAGAGVLETGGRVAKRVKDIAQGVYNPESVAARQLSTTLRSDMAHSGPGIDPEAAHAARQTGMPLALVDVGGQGTRDLARLAANSSSHALGDIERFVQERAIDQHPRLANFITRLTGRASEVAAEPQAARFGRLIRQTTGGADAATDTAGLREAARRANRPAYQRAYSAGDREIWSPELERLTSAPSVKQAMQAAVNKWKDWQVVDGFGGVNPGATVGNGGILTIRGGRTGVPAFPNIQFWDYTARNIADKAEAARRGGRTQLAAQLGGLERQLKTELDRMVPEYQAARQGAAQFFGGEDALDAGRAFARSSANIGEARRALQAMSAPERELFARGYASEKADLLERNASGGNLLDSAALSSPAERQKLELALGPRRAEAFERGIASDRAFHVFDGATSAQEAGRNFVSAEVSREDTARALARMTPQERDSFARGFGQELTRAIMGRQDNLTVVKKAFIDSHRARDKINQALGPTRARELEAAIRAEAVADKTKSLLGGSDTARKVQLAKIVAAHGAHAGVGAGAVIGLESLKETDLGFGSIVGGAIVLGGLRHGAMHVDAKVARKLGEMLVSSDPAVLHRASQVVARTPQLFNALRRGTEAGTRVAARDIGPSGVGAGVAAVLNSVLAEAEEHHGHHPDDQGILAQPAQQ